MAVFSNRDKTFPPAMKFLKSPKVWVGDTGATTHSTFSKEAYKNQRESAVSTTGITGGMIKPSIQMDIDCVHCDKNGNNQFKILIADVCHLDSRNLNMYSISRMMKQ